MENANDEAPAAEQEHQLPAAEQEHQLPAPELLDELISICLSRLTVRDLVRYRTVSKGFNSLILDPTFVRSHLRISPKNLSLAAVVTDGEGLNITCYEQRTVPHPNMTEKPEFRIPVDHALVPLTSCNGVLCLIERIGGGRRYHKPQQKKWIPEREYLKNKRFQHAGCPTKPRKAPRLIQNAPGILDEVQGYRLRFLNPATKKISQPSPLLECHVGRHCTSIGFGYDIVEKLHRVVVVSLTGNAVSYKYTMETKEWKFIGVFPALLVHSNDMYAEFLKDNAYVDGTLNWIATNSDRNQLFIISLNFTTDVFSQKSLPQGIQIQDITNFSKTHIGVLSDKLSFSYYSDRTHFVIWRLEEFESEESWFMLANISLEPLPMPVSEHQSPLVRFFPFNMFEEIDVLILLVRTDRYRLIFYNCQENVVVESQEFEFGEENAVLRWFDDAYYIESLIQPI